MLTDHEITQLRSDKIYRKLMSLGLKKFGADIVRAGDGEFRTDTSFGLKFIYSLSKSRIIQKELRVCADELLLKLLDCELCWPRKPEYVKSLCEMTDHGFIWMRFDIPRVTSLFTRCHNLLTNPEYRNLIKNYSNITADKNGRLTYLLNDLIKLKEDTISAIRAKGIYDGLIEYKKETFYTRNAQEIEKKFLGSMNDGVLGLPILENKSDKNDE